MAILDTEHKRKSLAITLLLLVLLVVGVFNFGMQYLDPPIEYGIAVNFGNSEVGSGAPTENTKQEEAIEEVKEEVVEENTEEQLEVEESIEKEVLTSETSKETPVVEKPKEEIKQKEIVKEKEVEKKEEKPKPSKEAANALNSLLNGTSNSGTIGEGDDTEQGTKGSENGDPDAAKYYGNSKGGSGGNYNLAGRKALSKPVQKPTCQEEGVVVVSIEVDQNGKVIKAIPGVKGSTNTHPCLMQPAKQAALQTKWNSDGKAPVKQKGTIIYRFTLSQ